MSSGPMETGKGSRWTGGIAGVSLIPSAAEGWMDALANPSSTSTEAWPVRMAIRVRLLPVMFNCTAMVMDAEPDAMPRSMARPQADAGLNGE